MISTIKKILITNIVFLNEKQKKTIIDFIIKILKNNIFIFFILGIILSIILSSRTNWDNFDKSSDYYYIYLYGHIELILYNFIPFIVSIVINLVIKFTKNETVKKIFKIVMIITNVLSVIYLLLWAWIIAFFELPPQS